MSDPSKPRAPRARVAVTIVALVSIGCSSRPAPPRAPEAAAEAPVTWFSLPAADVDKAASFYRDAFGWDVRPSTHEDDPTYDYRVVVNAPSDEAFVAKRPGSVNGCIVKKAIGLPSPVVLVEVPSLDAAMAKVVRAGGTVVSPKTPMKSLGGAFVLVRDPDGNVFELFATTPAS